MLYQLTNLPFIIIQTDFYRINELSIELFVSLIYSVRFGIYKFAYSIKFFIYLFFNVIKFVLDKVFLFISRSLNGLQLLLC